VDFGWFSFVAKPLFIALRYIYDHWIHNYGWAIIVLTVLLNTLLFPLKLKSIRSAQEMQKVAPLVKSIQERYKQYKFNDPRKQRMQQEITKLYQEHGINPLGGCLPMVLQLPLLYGFYELLLTAIELRHAPWIFCITDLSMPDKCHLFGIPLAILPTVMIITMFILQKMTPVATTDPAQQRMMLFMPLVFGAIFYNLASGLVLYYLTANVVGIAQQYFLNRRIPAPQSAPA
jgi:YidC/Oxa1 family membrane protein insertase